MASSPRNVLAVVVDFNHSSFYVLGRKEGLLERLYARDEFTTADNKSVDVHYVPSNLLSLQSASVTMYGSKQGIKSCNCKTDCIDKKCKCLSKNIKCHSNSSKN
jgi:predicted nucleotidyltransferase